MAAFPGFRLQGIRFNSMGDATQFHIQADERKAGKSAKKGAHSKGGDLHLVVNPASGTVLKTVDRHAGGWQFLRELHHDLLTGKTGRIANGIGALALLVMCLTGVVIWWPGARLWKQRLSIKSSTNWKRLNWDLHNAAGFWVVSGLAFFAFTGFQFAFPDVTKGALRSMTGSQAPQKKPRLAKPAHGLAPIELIVARAQAAVPDGRVRQIKFPKKTDEPVEARVKTAFDGHDEGNNRVFLEPSTDEVVRVTALTAFRWPTVPLNCWNRCTWRGL